MSDALPGPAEFDGELSDDLRGRVKVEIEPGERLLWAARATHAKSPPFGCAASGTAVVIVATLTALALWTIDFTGRPSNGLQFVLGLVSLFLTLLVLPGAVSAWNHRRTEIARVVGTLYALTDRRAIIWVPQDRKGTVAVHSFRRGQVSRVHRIERPDGSGDVFFSLAEGAGQPWSTPEGFKGIPEVRRVEDLTRRVLLMSPSRREDIDG